MFIKASLLLICALGSVGASTIVSTFGPGDTFTTFVGYRVGSGSSGVSPVETAVEFVPATNEELSQIRVGIFPFSATKGDRDLTVDLSQGTVPGTPIETFNATVGTEATVYSLTSALRPKLLAGQPYWIVLSSNDLVNNDFGWAVANVSSYSLLADRVPGSTLWDLTYSASPAFDVWGDPTIGVQSVPEPATMRPVITGMALILMGTKFRKRQNFGSSGTRCSQRPRAAF